MLTIPLHSLAFLPSLAVYLRRSRLKSGSQDTHSIAYRPKRPKIGMSKQEVKAMLEKEESISKNWKQVDDRWLLNGMDIVFEKDKCVEVAIGSSNFIRP